MQLEHFLYVDHKQFLRLLTNIARSNMATPDVVKGAGDANKRQFL
jgi:hypothetical protein